MAPPSIGVFSAGGDNNLKEKISHTIREIEVQRKDLERLRSRLEERRSAMFNSTVKAIEKSDELRARVFSGEHTELQKVTRVVNASELALLQIIVRLETLRDVGDVTFVLSRAFNEVKKITKSIQNLAPNLEASAKEINRAFIDLLAELGILTPDISVALSDTPEEIYEKAEKLIGQKTLEISELPKSIEELKNSEGATILENTKRVALLACGEGQDELGLEENQDFKPSLFIGGKIENDHLAFVAAVAKVDPEIAVRSYIREKGTERIDVIDCSTQLNLPVDLVEQAYIRLLSTFNKKREHPLDSKKLDADDSTISQIPRKAEDSIY